MTFSYTPPKAKLNPGEEYCPDCNVENSSTTVVWCDRCNNTGKIDWIQKAVKKPKAFSDGVLSMDANSMYPTVMSITGDTIISGELDCTTFSARTLDLIKVEMEQNIKEQVDKRIKELIEEGYLIPGGKDL